MKARMTSSHYDPYELGYTCATEANTKGSDEVTQSKTLKLVDVRIVL